MPTDTMTPANLINAMPDAAMIIGGNGHVLVANPAAREALGLDPLGLAVKSILRHNAFHGGVAEVRETQQPVHIELDLPSRPPRQFNASIALISTSGDVLVVLRDLTREQRIERMRSDFVANASHEMRTPLAAIIGTIETLQGAAKNDAKARERFFDSMLAQGKRMKRLIDDLLTLSRIELNEHVRPNAQVELSDVARQAKSNLVALIAEAKIEVNINSTQRAVVAGDADELLQVTQNLIENAIKYGASGAKIDVSCSAERGFGVLEVRDYGRGIAEDHIPRLTERFYRVSTQESRARGGTGLGLAIVKHIISRHRGKLDIASKLGEGAAFKISIPLYNS